MNDYRILLLLALSICLLPLAAQTPDTATITGQVVDQNQAAVPDVQIILTNSLTGLQLSRKTNTGGYFTAGSLPVAGNYKILASKQGFTPAQLDDIVLVGSTTANVDLVLAVAGMQAQITVTGVLGEIRTDQPQLGDRLGARQIEETPLLNRRITYLPLLNAANRPAINQGDIFMNQNLFTTNGSGRRQTWFEVDGSTGNDSWGRQTIFTNIPLAAVAEMDVLTSAFSAEYGGSTGSVVNIITKSGGNQWHGEALGMGRPSA